MLNVCVLGGSGFVGTELVTKLVHAGYWVRVPTRNLSHAARLRVLDTAGDVGEPALRAFLGHGYTERNALEVVLGIGTYVMSTLANRLTGAPVDDQVSAFA